MKRSKRSEEKTAGRNRTRNAIILAVAVVLIIGLVTGIAIYRNRLAPFRTTVLEVNGTSISMDYFLKRVAKSGEPSLTMLQTLTKEEIIKQSATKPPYNITATDQDVDRYAREAARGKNKTLTEGEFQEWYRQKLNESRFSDTELKDLLRTRRLGLRMREYLADRVPTIAEQVFVNMFPVENLAAGTEVKQKHDAGRNFSALAREYSVDPKLKDNGGVVGWIPRGVLDPGFDKAAFELAVGRISDPMYIDKHTVVVVIVSDKVAAREIDEQMLQVIKSKVLDNWLKTERQYHKVKFRGFKNGYDTETDAWVQWQLQRMKQ